MEMELDHYHMGIEKKPNLDYMYFNSWIDPLSRPRISDFMYGHIGHSEIIIKTELAKKLTPHNEKYGHDWVFIDEMRKFGKGIKSNSPELTYYVMSIMGKTTDKID